MCKCPLEELVNKIRKTNSYTYFITINSLPYSVYYIYMYNIQYQKCNPDNLNLSTTSATKTLKKTAYISIQ